MKRLLAILALSCATLPALSATRTVTLSVPGMTCAACPITVKKALTKVHGVRKADVSYENKQAKVTFDDAKVGIDALLKASTDAGYPATVVK